MSGKTASFQTINYINSQQFIHHYLPLFSLIFAGKLKFIKKKFDEIS